MCCLVTHKTDALAHFDEIYDLPFQKLLRQDCQNFVDTLGNDELEQVGVLSDLESILTFYCKNRNLKYESKNGWTETLLPILSLKLKRSETYNLFEAIRDTYIPKENIKHGNVYHVFRLLILYHDPELCAVLDTCKITPEMYSMSWFQSLFASTCQLSVVLLIWDLYFQQSDPFLVFFLSLIMLINRRDEIIAMRLEGKAAIVKFLSNMPCELDTEDVIDFCSLAQYYSTRTPASFKSEMLNQLFGTQTNVEEPVHVSQALCLPVSVFELIENTSENKAEGAVRFFLGRFEYYMLFYKFLTSIFSRLPSCGSIQLRTLTDGVSSRLQFDVDGADFISNCYAGIIASAEKRYWCKREWGTSLFLGIWSN